ncbi:hypothetical protein [Streptomyces sp. H39-S7]|uniref:hypothetical protein n=1 Tax=Streptomyces sp. H39-S7 TaxID=3004357 RepID=UPI0022B02C96|nr:hypothetical protein [Streptomyces sp. H39-S7]MCZ4122132.1 hypothetical protein [Streptomyces sp. H39-S7]
MSHHARPKSNSLLRAAATATVAAAAVLAAGGSASAGVAVPALTDAAGLGADSAVGTTLGTHSALGSALGPIKHLAINPLAHTGTDPLDNVVTPQVADFKPISTGAVTGPLAEGDSLSELPLLGPLSELLPG